jgi:hypothetical protein
VSQSLDIRFDEFMADDLGTVENIYALADQPFGADAKAAIVRYRDSHPRGRHGGVIYDLADFDLDADRIRAATRGYTARFMD